MEKEIYYLIGLCERLEKENKERAELSRFNPERLNGASMAYGHIKNELKDMLETFKRTNQSNVNLIHKMVDNILLDKEVNFSE